MDERNPSVEELVMDEKEYASVALVFYLFAIFCAYWAQSTDRDPWGWFFFGLFLAPIAGLVLLHESSKDQRKLHRPGKSGGIRNTEQPAEPGA